MTHISFPRSLGADQARTRIHELTVIDVRTPAEYASGHLPGALNIPLDQIRRALPEIRHAAEATDVLVVCASGTRSANACEILAEQGVVTATLVGGTGAWTAAGHGLDTPAARDTRAVWSMERQVRFTAGSAVLLGVLLGLLVHPVLLLMSAGMAGGLVYSAVTNTCGMATLLGKLPHNRPGAADLNTAREALRNR
ncbi:rhodanese-like domain-containing protein [Streptomyces sp. ID05-04B]|uniref:rhodanese-like domain-containing protein n=1 Tax=unclassified Streptomyces TaxID=2593676 RepID=UPI000D1A9B2A|nr:MULTISPECIES: rhodanese-like domain-containing protein [unclassified Streptomyces]AVV45911.1 transporter [Streptomyces sp. P3]MDX5565543.1 rhodanese-like domain-containing protein [Streptomyces sp. ID05-04B]